MPQNKRAAANSPKSQDTLQRSSTQEQTTNTMANLNSAPNIWRDIKTPSKTVAKRSHHSSVMVGDKMYVYGGYQTGHGILKDFLTFDFVEEKWEKVDVKPFVDQQGKIVSSEPGMLHSHSCVHYGNVLIFFGGIVNTLASTNKCFEFNLQTMQWRQLITKFRITEASPPAMNSHTAKVYQDQMIVFGGQEQIGYNNKVLSLNLKSLQWKVLATLSPQTNSPLPRSECSVELYKNKLYIFGGKNQDAKFNDLWPSARSGHGSIIYENYLVIFGGTTGVTHERNDLLVYNIKDNYWRIHWQDSQSLRNNQKRQDGVGAASEVAVLKRSNMKKLIRTNSAKNSINSPNLNRSTHMNTSSSSFYQQRNIKGTKINSKNEVSQPVRQNKQKKSVYNHRINKRQKSIDDDETENCRDENDINSNNNGNGNGNGNETINQSEMKSRKYRQPMKQENYYNENYPFYGEKDGLRASQFKKNDLLMDLERESQEQNKAENDLSMVQAQQSNAYQSQISNRSNSPQSLMAQTFQSLNQSILVNIVQNIGKNDSSLQGTSKKQSLHGSGAKQPPHLLTPQSRDGHTCCVNLSKEQLVIFGGDRHHINFNDVVLVSLAQVLRKENHSKGWQEQPNQSYQKQKVPA